MNAKDVISFIDGNKEKAVKYVKEKYPNLNFDISFTNICRPMSECDCCIVFRVEADESCDFKVYIILEHPDNTYYTNNPQHIWDTKNNNTFYRKYRV